MSIADMFVDTNDTDTHRVCGTCGKLKPVEDFYKDGHDKKTGKPKYRRDCKECYKATRIREAELKKGRNKK